MVPDRQKLSSRSIPLSLLLLVYCRTYYKVGVARKLRVFNNVNLGQMKQIINKMSILILRFIRN